MTFAGRYRAGLALAATIFLATPAVALQPAPAAPPATAPAAASVAEPRPAIWLLEDEDTKIYLFGTTHAFPATVRWRSPRLNEIVATADELVLEIAEQGSADFASSSMSADDFARMLLPEPSPILDRVPETLRPRLRAALDAIGAPMERWDRMHIWAAAFALSGIRAAEEATARFGADALRAEQSSAETVLADAFRQRGKPISGVETGDAQLGALANLSMEDQFAFLEAALDGRGMGAVGNDLNAGTWTRGDVDAIAAEMATMPPVLIQALLVNRNRTWTTWLTERLERPGTVLFAVGAGHLVGSDSVQVMLAARGLTVRRID